MDRGSASFLAMAARFRLCEPLDNDNSFLYPWGVLFHRVPRPFPREVGAFATLKGHIQADGTGVFGPRRISHDILHSLKQ